MSVSLNSERISSVVEPKALEEEANNTGQTMPEALEYSYFLFIFHQNLKQIFVKLRKMFICGFGDYLTLVFALAFCF